tara:strand:- start:1873 stop:2283 length:411 start_codon:yes stop_codon:yes gene_type:complete
MKKLILLLLFPAISIAQDLNTALNMHNTIRGYYNLKPLVLNDTLSNIASERAKVTADLDKIVFTNDDLGESVFYTDYITISRDYFLEATISWILEQPDQTTLKQILCKQCSSVGFGVALSDDKVWVVAKYDKIYKK